MCMLYSAKLLGRTYVCRLGSIDLVLADFVVDVFSKKFDARLQNPGLYEIYCDGFEVKADAIPCSSWATYKYFPTAATKPKTDSQPRSTGIGRQEVGSRHIRFTDEDEPSCSTLPRGTGTHTCFNDEDDANEKLQ